MRRADLPLHVIQSGLSLQHLWSLTEPQVSAPAYHSLLPWGIALNPQVYHGAAQSSAVKRTAAAQA